MIIDHDHRSFQQEEVSSGWSHTSSEDLFFGTLLIMLVAQAAATVKKNNMPKSNK
jgi:hypothetical protein